MSQISVPQQHTDPHDIAIKSIPNFGIDDDDVSTKKNADIHYANFTKAPGVDDVDYAKTPSSDFVSGNHPDFNKEVHVDKVKVSFVDLHETQASKQQKVQIPKQHTDKADIAVNSLPNDGIDSDEVSTLKNANIHYTKAPGVANDPASSSHAPKKSEKSSINQISSSQRSSNVVKQRTDPNDISKKSLPNDGIGSDEVSTLKNANIHYTKAPGVANDSAPSSQAKKSDVRSNNSGSSKKSSHVVKQHTDPSDIAVKSLPNDGIDNDQISTLKNANVHYTKAPGVGDEENSGNQLEQAKDLANRTNERVREKANELGERANESWQAAKSKATEMIDQSKEKGQQILHHTKEKGQQLLELAQDKVTEIKRSAKESKEEIKNESQKSKHPSFKKADVDPDELKAEAKRNAEELKEQADQKIEQGKQSAKDTIHAATAKTAEVRDATLQKTTAIKDAAVAKTNQLKETVAETYEHGIAKANEAYEAVRHKANDAKESGKETLSNIKQSAAEANENAKQEGTKLAEDVRQGEEGQSILGHATALVGNALSAVQEKTSEFADSARELLGLSTSDSTTEVYEVHEKEFAPESDGSIHIEKQEKWIKQEGSGPKEIKEHTSKYIKHE